MRNFWQSIRNILIYPVISVFFIETSFADGRAVGNGGLGVKCEDNIEVLDLTNGRFLWDHTHQILGNLAPALGFEGIRRKVLLKWLRLDPQRAALYALETRDFFSNTKFLENVDLEPTADSGGFVAIPEKCSIVQLAVQRKPMFPGEKRYYLTETHWKSLDALNRSALVFHELIYTEAIALGFTESYAIRFLVSLIHSDQFESVKQNEYNAFLKTAGIPPVVLEGSIENSFQRPLPVEFWSSAVTEILGASKFVDGIRLAGKSSSDSFLSIPAADFKYAVMRFLGQPTGVTISSSNGEVLYSEVPQRRNEFYELDIPASVFTEKVVLLSFDNSQNVNPVEYRGIWFEN